MTQNVEGRDFPYLSAMNEVLEMTSEFIEHARNAQDDVMMGAYLKLASRAMRSALEIYGEHLAENRAEMQQGEVVQ